MGRRRSDRHRDHSARAHAWTPGTHVFLGEAVMRSLAYCRGRRRLLQEFPYDFLYGSIAADTSIAKKYARRVVTATRGTSAWRSSTARATIRFGHSTRLSAHLAADSVAHNYFVPTQLAVTTSTSGFGHSYWRAGSRRTWARVRRRARELILIDHSRSDGLLDRVLSPTIFSTPTIAAFFGDGDRCRQRVVATHLPVDEGTQPVGSGRRRRESLSRASYDFIMDLLMRMDGAEPYRLDPSGEHALRMAKRVRRQVLRQGDELRLREEADRYFGMPARRLLRRASRCRSTRRAAPQQLIDALGIGSLRALHTCRPAALEPRSPPRTAAPRGKVGEPASIQPMSCVSSLTLSKLSRSQWHRAIAGLHHGCEHLLGALWLRRCRAPCEQRSQVGWTNGEMGDRLPVAFTAASTSPSSSCASSRRRSAAQPARSTRPSGGRGEHVDIVVVSAA